MGVLLNPYGKPRGGRLVPDIPGNLHVDHLIWLGFFAVLLVQLYNAAV